MPIYIEICEMIGILLSDIIEVLRPIVMEKVAFIFGSSKLGKLRLESVGSNCVIAMYLIKKKVRHV